MDQTSHLCCPMSSWCLLGQLPIPLALLDDKGRFLLTNGPFRDIVEYTQEELSERTWQEVTYPSDVREDERQHQLLRDKKISSYRLTKRYVTKSGAVVWVRVNVCLMENGCIKFLSFVEPIDTVSPLTSGAMLAAYDPEPTKSWGARVAEFLLMNAKVIITCLALLAGYVATLIADWRSLHTRLATVQAALTRTDQELKEIKTLLKVPVPGGHPDGRPSTE